MRRFLGLVALSVVVSLTLTAVAFLITRSDRFRAIAADCCGAAADAAKSAESAVAEAAAAAREATE
jgi:hypothetical protein